MPSFKNFYHIIVIILMAVALVAIRMITFKSTPPPQKERNLSVVPFDSKQLKEALCDSCKLSGSKLTCSPDLIRKIVTGVDSLAMNTISVSQESITFNKRDGYIEVPATIVVNMIDLGVLNNTKKEQCNEQ